MKLGCLLFVIGILIGAAGLFAWQIASDSPAWHMSGVIKIIGLVLVALGSLTGLYGIIRIASRKRTPPAP